MSRQQEKLAYMKFYPTDWRSDPRLRMCSAAARGLWLEIMCLMHEAESYGYLLVSGQRPTNAQLAVLAGIPSEQIPDLLGELESAGVFSRTGQGTIYSRRMTRDEKKRRTARKNGKSGGNPTLSKKSENPSSDNQQDKPPDKGGDKTQRPEARGQRPESSDPDGSGADPPPLSEIIFGQGLRFLAKCGVAEKQARSILGKWRKLHGDERVLAALGKAQREGALDPVAFCEGVFRQSNGHLKDKHPERWTSLDGMKLEGSADLEPGETIEALKAKRDRIFRSGGQHRRSQH